MKKARKILTLAVAAALAASMLTACQSSERETYFEVNSEGEVVDSELFEKIEQESVPLNTKIENYSCHSDRNLFIGTSNFITLSDKFLYNYDGVGNREYVKIDLQSGEVIPLCDVAGCTHDSDDFPDCINNRNIGWITAVGDEIWYDDANKLIVMKDGKEEVIYENKYCTEYEEATRKNGADEKYGILFIVADDNYVYLFGFSYVVQVDRNTMKAVKTIDLPTETDLRTPVVYKGSIYFCNELQEAFKTDIESGETKKLGDHVNCVYVWNDTIYYTDWNDGAVTLYKADLDLQNSEKLLDDCYMNFVIKDNKLFYSKKSNGEIMCYDLDTGENKLIYKDIGSGASIFTADYIDRVFFIGGYVNPDDTNEKYDVIASVRTDGSDLWVKKYEGSIYN